MEEMLDLTNTLRAALRKTMIERDLLRIELDATSAVLSEAVVDNLERALRAEAERDAALAASAEAECDDDKSWNWRGLTQPSAETLPRVTEQTRYHLSVAIPLSVV